MRISDWSSDVCSSDLPNKKPRRATTHSRHKTPSGQPCNGLIPVQVALEVSKNPTAMVMMKPHSISWACQNTPNSGPSSHCGAKIHSEIEISAQENRKSVV